MYKGSFVSALIAAAGQGKRMKSDINKQYLKLVDKPILAHTLEVFLRCDMIDEIILIVGQDEMKFCQEEVIDKYGFNQKPIKLVFGGKERQESVLNGLNSVSNETEIVVTHDGARPFITVDIIERSIFGAHDNGAVGVGVPVKDTIKVVDEDKNIIDTPKRSKLWQIQTPQTFSLSTLKKAHLHAQKEGFLGTDDSVLVERIGQRVKMIKGSYENIKITTPEDLFFGESILKRRQSKIQKSNNFPGNL